MARSGLSGIFTLYPFGSYFGLYSDRASTSGEL